MFGCPGWKTAGSCNPFPLSIGVRQPGVLPLLPPLGSDKFIGDGTPHGRMNYKDTKPYMSAFLSLNRLCGILFNRFYRLEIHSLMVCIFDPACQLLPPWTKELYGTCCPSTVPSLWPPPPGPPPSQSTVYTDSVWLWGVWWGCWNVLWTIFCKSFTLCFWPDSEPTK